MSSLVVHRNAHQIYLNNPDKMISLAHRGEKWANVNHSVGEKSTSLLDLHLLTGIFADWLFSFQDQENIFTNLFSNSWNAISGALFGKREEDMYTKIYCAGLDKVDDEDLNDQKQVLSKFPYMDDYMEMAHFLKDRVLNSLWKSTTSVSKWSPMMFFGSAFLGKKWSDLIFSLSQTFSRITWRCSYLLPASLHNNVVETVFDLSRYKLMSFFNNDAKARYQNLTENLEAVSKDYAQKMYGSHDKLNEKKGLSSYFWMLSDRMKQQKRGINKPEEVLREKVGKTLTETTEEERKNNPDKILEKGYVIPTSPSDKTAQARVSIVNYTAPYCAAVGLAGSMIFEPLRCLWNVAGFERGKKALSFLANLRGPASLTNYFFKLFLPEREIGLDYKKLEKYVKNGTANEAITQLYQARKNRLLNSYLGMGTLVGSVFDSIGQLFRSFQPESRAENFLFSSLSRFINYGFVRYFSARRRDWGKTEQVYLAAQKVLGKDNVTDEEIQKISDEEFTLATKSLGKDEPEPEVQESVYDPFFSWLGNKWKNLSTSINPLVESNYQNKVKNLAIN